MNRIDRLLIFIERASVIYYARAVEACAALTLIGLAIYISDERVITYGLVTPPKGVPINIIRFILIAVAVAQIVGITMPLIHDWFNHRGFKSRWLTKVWVNEKTWRVCALVAVIASLGAFAGLLMSPVSWAGWLVVGGYCLLLTISIFRLEATTDADRGGATGNESVSRHDPGEPGNTVSVLDKGTLEMAQPPQDGATQRAAVRCTGNLPA